MKIIKQGTGQLDKNILFAKINSFSDVSIENNFRKFELTFYDKIQVKWIT